MASPLKRKDVLMTGGSIPKHLILFSVPLLIGNVFQQLYNTVDSIVVGNCVGKEALAAVGTVTPIINTLIGFFLGLSAGAGVVISQYYGAREEEKVKASVQTTMALVFLLCGIFTAVGVLMVPFMLRMMQTPEDVFPQASLYLRIYFGGVAGLLLYNMGSGILRAVGDSRRPLYFLIFSAGTNTALDLLFVAGLGMGVAGAAVATILAQGLSALLVLAVLTRTKDAYRICWGEIRIDRKILRSIWRIGLPSALQMAVTSFSNVFVQSYVNRFGSSCMAGWASYLKIDSFVILPMMTLSMSATTFVGQNAGAGDMKRAREGIKYSMLLALAITGALLIPVVVFATFLCSLFNQEPEVLRYGAFLTRVISPFYLLCTVNQIYSGALRGAGETKVPMVIMLGSFVVFRQIYLFLTYHLIGTLLPVALGYPVGWILCSILMTVYYRRGKWMEQCFLVTNSAAAQSTIK